MSYFTWQLELVSNSLPRNVDECDGSCNVGDLSPKISVSSESKYVNVKVFNIITRINVAKIFIKHISCDF